MRQFAHNINQGEEGEPRVLSCLTSLRLVMKGTLMLTWCDQGSGGNLPEFLA